MKKGRSSSRWSVRTAFLTATLVFAALALMTVTALMAVTSYLHRTTESMGEAVDSVRAVEQLETHLLIYDRAAHLADARDGDVHEAVATAEVAKIRQWLRVARKHVAGDNVVEATLVDDVTEAIEAHLAMHRVSARAEETLPERAAELDASLDRTRRLLESLVELNVAQADSARAQAAEWDRLGNGLGLALSVSLVAIVPLLFLGAQRSLYAPLVAIREKIARFGAGDADARAPEQGPRELAEIAHTFNETASALVRQREMLFTFLAGVAHDLRNPLSALRLSTGVVIPDRPLPGEERLRRMFELIRRQVDRIDRMVEDLLDASRIEAGALDLRVEDQDLRGIAREAVELYAASTQTHALHLLVPEEPVPVRGDPGRLGQVLNNLISNAVKYSPDGTQVRVVVEMQEREACVAVSDEGPGIPPEELSRIFEPFRRGAATREKAPGAGLGLSVARRIVEAHHGHVEVESQSRGSTFRVCLPAGPPAPAV